MNYLLVGTKFPGKESARQRKFHGALLYFFSFISGTSVVASLLGEVRRNTQRCTTDQAKRENWHQSVILTLFDPRGEVLTSLRSGDVFRLLLIHEL